MYTSKKLNMFLNIESEIHSDEAKVELNNIKTSLRVMLELIKTCDNLGCCGNAKELRAIEKNKKLRVVKENEKLVTIENEIKNSEKVRNIKSPTLRHKYVYLGGGGYSVKVYKNKKAVYVGFSTDLEKAIKIRDEYLIKEIG